MTSSIPSRAYHGPLPAITVADAQRLLPLLRGRPELDDIAGKLRLAVGADPKWRRPIR
jgi:hypothetical protein